MTLKWDTSDVSVHRTTCGRYTVVRALPDVWHAYQLTPLHTGNQLGTTYQTSEAAREVCDTHAQEKRA